MKKIVVGLSGGVDSSVSAWLLQQQGYQVEGLFMKNWEEDDTPSYCAAAKDLADAEAVGRLLNIPVHTVNFASEYWEHVFCDLVEGLKRGITPNPDILCNKEVKFKYFLEYACSVLGADAIATGHYARTLQTQYGLRVAKALDRQKDQSYFLYTLDEATLERVEFPLGTVLKSEVRKLATQLGLPTAQKKDSTGICFIGKRPFADFLAKYIPTTPGPIVSEQGKQLGMHQGLFRYTLGQRQGLGIGGHASNPQGLPWYVVEKQLETNTLVVALGAQTPSLWSTRFYAQRLVWFGPNCEDRPLQCEVKTRYRQTGVPVSVRFDPHYADRLEVTSADPIWAVTPGQSAVFYLDQQVLGGGPILLATK